MSECGATLVATRVAKVLVVGDVCTGKTSLIRRYVHGFFSPEHRTTVGVDFALKSVKLEDNNSRSGDCVSLQLWDIAGQERFHGLSRVYYRDALAALVVFDLTHRASLDSAIRWVADIQDKVVLRDATPIPVILVANKSDLCVECDDAAIRAVAKAAGCFDWVKTSAKTGDGVERTFQAVAAKIMQNEHELKVKGLGYFEQEDQDDEDEDGVDNNNPVVRVQSNPVNKRSNNCC
jgi:small GTP-binding protein